MRYSDYLRDGGSLSASLMSRLRLRESNIGTDSFTPISQSFASSICLRETFVWVGTVTTNREGRSINGSSSLNFRHVSVFLSPAGLCSDVSPEPGGFHSSCSAKLQQGAARRFAGPIELEVVGPDQYQRLTFYLWFLRGAPHFPTSAGTAGAPIKIIYS